jgi:hypothetical protein
MVDPTNATGKRNVESAVVEGRTLELRVGDINGVQHIWTRLTNARGGDVIWIDRTTDGGQTWKVFGKRTITAGGRNYTDALRTSPSEQVRMRAWTDLKDGDTYNTAPF